MKTKICSAGLNYMKLGKEVMVSPVKITFIFPILLQIKTLFNQVVKCYLLLLKLFSLNINRNISYILISTIKEN